jgi:hypothetical protein
MNNKKNKICAIGDIHGRVIWRSIVDKELINVDKFIFIGDYFDSREGISAEEQIKNFKEILELKRNNPEKVVLLIGNHCFHYMNGVNETYSGFQYHNLNEINEVLEDALSDKSMQMCYIHDKYVFTHAGVTNTWCLTHNVNRLPNKMQDSINDLFDNNKMPFHFQMGQNYSQSGDDITQSPIWVRIPSLFHDGVDGFRFVVGHSTVKELTITDKIIGIDCLGVTGEYLVIQDGEVFSKKI